MLSPSKPLLGRTYNALATVQAKDGSTAVYRLPFLIALGVTPARKVQA
jgi:hypothetical protein